MREEREDAEKGCFLTFFKWIGPGIKVRIPIKSALRIFDQYLVDLRRERERAGEREGERDGECE